VSAKHALLGLLIHRPAYRYQLGERLQERLGPSWAINSGQLYQTVERMYEDGLIELVDGSREDRTERDVYAITASGVEEFDRWFEESTHDARQPRRPLLAKIALAGPDRLKEALRQIEAYERDCAASVNGLTQQRDAIPRAPVVGSRVRADQVFLRLSLSADVAHLEAELKWAKDAHEIVSWLLTEDAIWPPEYGRSGTSKQASERAHAREELFGRIAARSLKEVPGKRREDRDADSSPPPSAGS
jgi:DNA-binding PadR family transcriptional regulator